MNVIFNIFIYFISFTPCTILSVFTIPNSFSSIIIFTFYNFLKKLKSLFHGRMTKRNHLQAQKSQIDGQSSFLVQLQLLQPIQRRHCQQYCHKGLAGALHRIDLVLKPTNSKKVAPFSDEIINQKRRRMIQ